MRFSTAFINKFEANHLGYMVALYPSKESINNLVKYQKLLNLKDPIKPDILHVTLRYYKGYNDQIKVKNILNDLKLPKALKCDIIGLDILGDENTLVILLKSKELSEFQNVLDNALVNLGVPESDYPVFKAHVSLASDHQSDLHENSNTPKFNDNLILDKIKFVYDDKILWEKDL